MLTRPACLRFCRGPAPAWCLGDLGGFGPHPDRSVAILREAQVPTLRGNYDDSIGHERHDCACGYTDPEDARFAQISFDYTLARTAQGHKAWLRDLRGVSYGAIARDLELDATRGYDAAHKITRSK